MARSRKKPGRTSPVDYHHGDLRQALVDATLEAIADHGAQGITLREVARAVGVSHMAPYNHFADKAALLSAAAAEGFRRLKAAMDGRMSRFAIGDPRRVQAVGVAYTVFAVENPDLFRLMFGPELANASGSEELTRVAGETFGCLLGALAETGVDATDPAAAQLALTPWALVHGLATLAVAGRLPRSDPTYIERLALQATEVLYHGMANVRPPGPAEGAPAK